jgi:hypothetical protein
MSGKTGTRRRPPAAGRESRPAQPGGRSSRTRCRPTRWGRGRSQYRTASATLCHNPRRGPALGVARGGRGWRRSTRSEVESWGAGRLTIPVTPWGAPKTLNTKPRSCRLHRSCGRSVLLHERRVVEAPAKRGDRRKRSHDYAGQIDSTDYPMSTSGQRYDECHSAPSRPARDPLQPVESLIVSAMQACRGGRGQFVVVARVWEERR